MKDHPFGLYVYCIAGELVVLPNNLTGIDPEHPVYFIEKEGIFIAVSSVSFAEFNEEKLEKKMTDSEWLLPKAKRHEEVVEFIMNSAPPNGVQETDTTHIPVVPLRFCTVYKDCEGIFHALLPHKEKVIEFLEYTRDKTEWSVKVFCDKITYLEKCMESKGLTENNGQDFLLPGENYLLKKKQRTKREHNFKADIQQYLTDIHETLSTYADQNKFLRCTDKNVHGKQMDMIMNTAFLVQERSLHPFKDTVDALIKKYQDKGFVFELSGPWPPYSFCPETK